MRQPQKRDVWRDNNKTIIPPPNCAMTEDTTTRKPLRNTRENEKYKAYTTMSKLIEEAENLYKQIDKAQVHLINARLNNDEEGKKSAIFEMGKAMCNAMQLLKCFIERKDNIVDLSEVWKDGKKEKPIPCSDIVIRDCCITSGYDDVVDESQWAYLDDLLPKGGD